MCSVPPGVLILHSSSSRSLAKAGKRSKLPGVAHRPTSLVAMELGTVASPLAAAGLPTAAALLSLPVKNDYYEKSTLPDKKYPMKTTTQNWPANSDGSVLARKPSEI